MDFLRKETNNLEAVPLADPNSQSIYLATEDNENVELEQPKTSRWSNNKLFYTAVFFLLFFIGTMTGAIVGISNANNALVEEESSLPKDGFRVGDGYDDEEGRYGDGGKKKKKKKKKKKGTYQPDYSYPGYDDYNGEGGDIITTLAPAPTPTP